MSDDLYHELILAHAKRPHGAGIPPAADRRVSLDNPFCGDAVTVGARLVDGRIADIGFEADGCAVAKASASMMTVAVAGKTPVEVTALFDQLQAMLSGAGGDAAALGDLVALSGVSRYPVRRRCATLAWEALRAAILPGVVG